MRTVSVSQGFTLVELIVIFLIIGILAVVVVPRFLPLQAFAIPSFYNQTLAMVRYAQKVAVAQRTPVQVRVESATGSVCLKYGNAAEDLPCGSLGNDALNPADGKPFMQTAPQDVAMRLNAGSDTVFSFNGLGQPNTAASLSGSSLRSALTIDIMGGGQKRTITIERETGYVH